MKRVWYFLLLIFFSNTICQGQTGTTDSLKKIINTGNINKDNLNVYRQVASAYTAVGQYDSAILIYQMAVDKSIELNNSYWLPKYTLWLGGIYTAIVKYDSAEKYLEQGNALIQKTPNDSLLAQYYQNKGTLYQFKNENDNAAAYLLKSIEVLERMGDKRPKNLLCPAYQNMAGIFNNENQHAKALVYDQKALACTNDLLNKGDYALVYFNSAVTHRSLNDIKNYKIYLDSAYYFATLFENPRTLLNIYGGYGVYYESINKYDSALSYYQKAMHMSKEGGDSYFFAEQAINTAGILFKQNKIAGAKRLLDEAIPLAKEFQDYTMLAGIYKGQKEIAVKTGNYRAATEFAELYKQYADSSTNEASQQTILSLEAKYQNQKKEKEIADLKIKNTEKQLTVVKRNRLLIGIGIAALSLLSILGLLYRNSKQKQLLSHKENIIQQEQIKFLERQQQVVSLQSMINGQETERTRIAKDLHDGLGGLFSTIKMQLSTLKHEEKHLEENKLFSKSYELVDNASVEVRRIAHNMMPEVLMKMGLEDALKDMCNNISAGKLLSVSFQAYGMERRLNTATEIMLFRIIQELLNNIIKHAQATEAIIQFNQDKERLHVTVEDNGRGFDIADNRSANHAGLDTVQSRVNYLNGKLSIESQKNLGTTVMMEFLINEK